jgi:hypothetical protein
MHLQQWVKSNLHASRAFTSRDWLCGAYSPDIWKRDCMSTTT